jgi:hypothetical protein
MKTTSKKIIAVLSALTMTAVSALSVSAEENLEEIDSVVVFENGVENGTDNGTVRYDLDNKAYIEKVNSYPGKIAMENEFLEYLNSVGPKELAFSDDGVNFHYSPAPVAKHVYKAIENFIDEKGVYVVVEFSNTKNERWFQYCEFYFEDHMFRNYGEIVSKYTVDEMNEYLKSQGFKAHLTEETLELYERSEQYYAIHYDDRSEENVFGAILALNKKYGVVSSGMGLVDGVEYYRDAVGDANNDGAVNVRDCALIASSIASGKADSLPDTADYNKDGKKNIRDAASLSNDLAAN